MLSETKKLTRRIRAMLWVFIVGLVVSGATAFPLVGEIKFLACWLDKSRVTTTAPTLVSWIATVQAALNDTDVRYPFLAYGTDCLAFGHIVIALFFVGVLMESGTRKTVSI